MIKLILVLLILIAGVVVALQSFDDQNYVVIGVAEWRMQTSLTVFVGMLVALFVPSFMLVRAAFALWRSPRTLRSWRRQRRDKNAQATLNNGLTLLVEGRWRAAERELTRALSAGANPMLGFIAAARAAQALGAVDRRDEYLRKASDAQPSTSIAVGVTQAELHMDEQHREQALATLLQLRNQTPNHERILALLRRLFEDLRDWKGLLDILPSLKHRRVVTHGEAHVLEVRALSGLLVQSAASTDLAELGWRWSSLSRSMQSEPALLGLYAELMLRRGEGSSCEPLLRAALDKQWHQGLVRVYGLLPGANPGEQLKHAESWLPRRQDDAILLECLGRLCVSNRLWGKARSYLDAALAIDPHTDTYAIAVQLLDELEDEETAGRYARQGLEHAAPRESFLSDPEWTRVLGAPSLRNALPAPASDEEDAAQAVVAQSA